MDLTEVCRWLNRAKLSAAPCAWLGAISIFVDERYESSDFDILGPDARRTIARVLGEQGLRQRTGSVFEGPCGRLVVPKASWNLSGDPARALEDALRGPGQAAFATPTQVLFLTLRRTGDALPVGREDELLELVFEQPANLDKVAEWLRRSDGEAAFDRIHARLAARQEEGRVLRQQHAFRSRLPT